MPIYNYILLLLKRLNFLGTAINHLYHILLSFDCKKHFKENDTDIRYSGFKCECKNKVLWMGFLYVSKGLPLVFGLFLAWETRNVKFKMLNDSKNIGMSVYNIVIWVCVTIPLELTVVRDEPNARFGVVASAINICTTCTMVLVFVPKVICFICFD